MHFCSGLKSCHADTALKPPLQHDLTVLLPCIAVDGDLLHKEARKHPIQ